MFKSNQLNDYDRLMFCLFVAWRDEVQGMSRTGGVLKAVLTVEQGDGHLGAVVLWGAALSWLLRLEKNKGITELN